MTRVILVFIAWAFFQMQDITLLAQNNNSQLLTPEQVGNYSCGSAFYANDYFAHAMGSQPLATGQDWVQAYYIVNVQDSNHCELEFLINNRSFMTVYGPINNHMDACNLIENNLLQPVINFLLGTNIPSSSSHPFPDYFQHTLIDLESGIYVVKFDISGGGSLANPTNQNPPWVYLYSPEDNVDGCFDFLSTPIPCEDCITSFRPTPGHYMVSAWVKEDFSGNQPVTYENCSLVVSFTGAAETYVLTPKGQIIDGWQRIEAEIIIPDGATEIHLDLVASGAVDCYFDDIRFLPYDGSMMSYVYDHRNLRLIAQLDERNYATLYEYDEEGKLIRVKKETERGIMTIQENRDNIVKKPGE